MKRVMTMVVAVAALFAVGACDKPGEGECRKAIANIQKIYGIENSTGAPDAEAFVRKCRAQSSGKSVRCMIDAKTIDDVAKCEGGKSGK